VFSDLTRTGLGVILLDSVDPQCETVLCV